VAAGIDRQLHAVRVAGDRHLVDDQGADASG